MRFWKKDALFVLPICHIFHINRTSLVAQLVKHPPGMQVSRLCSLGPEDSLEKNMAAHSSILAWGNPIDRQAWWATVHGVARVGHDLATKSPSY